MIRRAQHYTPANYDKTNRAAALLVIEDPARYGGEESGLVRWARDWTRNQKEARLAKRWPPGQGKLELRAAEEKSA